MPLNGKYYHCDFTWMSTNYKEYEHSLLLCSDSYISKIKYHNFNAEYSVPVTDTTYDNQFKSARYLYIKNCK